MAQAERRLNTQDRCVIAAAAAYCAENDAIERLCDEWDTLPDELADPCFARMQAAKRRALRYPAASMAGVLAKARMVAVGELFDVDPLIASTILDLLRVADDGATGPSIASPAKPLLAASPLVSRLGAIHRVYRCLAEP